MVANNTGQFRIRSAIPKELLSGDKTGTCNPYTLNDIAFVESKKVAVIAVYIYGKIKKKIDEKYISSIAKLIVGEYSIM